MNPSESGNGNNQRPIIRFWNADFVWLWPLGVMIGIGLAIHAWHLAAHQQWPKISWQVIAVNAFWLVLAAHCLSLPARTIELTADGRLTAFEYVLIGPTQPSRSLDATQLAARIQVEEVPDRESESHENVFQLVVQFDEGAYLFRTFAARAEAEALRAEMLNAHAWLANASPSD